MTSTTNEKSLEVKVSASTLKTTRTSGNFAQYGQKIMYIFRKSDSITNKEICIHIYDLETKEWQSYGDTVPNYAFIADNSHMMTDYWHGFDTVSALAINDEQHKLTRFMIVNGEIKTEELGKIEKVGTAKKWFCATAGIYCDKIIYTDGKHVYLYDINSSQVVNTKKLPDMSNFAYLSCTSLDGAGISIYDSKKDLLYCIGTDQNSILPSTPVKLGIEVLFPALYHLTSSVILVMGGENNHFVYEIEVKYDEKVKPDVKMVKTNLGELKKLKKIDTLDIINIFKDINGNKFFCYAKKNSKYLKIDIPWHEPFPKRHLYQVPNNEKYKSFDVYTNDYSFGDDEIKDDEFERNYGRIRCSDLQRAQHNRLQTSDFNTAHKIKEHFIKLATDVGNKTDKLDTKTDELEKGLKELAELVNKNITSCDKKFKELIQGNKTIIDSIETFKNQCRESISKFEETFEYQRHLKNDELKKYFGKHECFGYFGKKIIKEFKDFEYSIRLEHSQLVIVRKHAVEGKTTKKISDVIGIIENFESLYKSIPFIGNIIGGLITGMHKVVNKWRELQQQIYLLNAINIGFEFWDCYNLFEYLAVNTLLDVFRNKNKWDKTHKVLGEASQLYEKHNKKLNDEVKGIINKHCSDIKDKLGKLICFGIGNGCGKDNLDLFAKELCGCLCDKKDPQFKELTKKLRGENSTDLFQKIIDEVKQFGQEKFKNKMFKQMKNTILQYFQ